MQKDVQNCSPTIDAVGSFRHLFTSKWWEQIFCFFTILYHLLDCKMVSDRFWMIYGIAENPFGPQLSVWNKPPPPGGQELPSI